MKNNELETKIERAFAHAVPDVLESVLSSCDEQKGSVIPMTKKIQTEKKNNHLWAKRFGGIAAAFVLLVGCAVGYGTYRQSYAVDSTVSLDVNPSVEIQVNRKDQVLDVTALNEDGKTVIGDMDFAGSDLDVTVNALIGSMLQNGYLSELANSILISVDNSDAQRSAELQEKLTEEVNTLLQTTSFNGAVLSQTVSDDSALAEQAEQYGITQGKAQLIQEITAKNTRYTFENLVPLSINELNLLLNSADASASSGSSDTETETQVKSVGSASDKSYIGEDKAEEAALKRAGVSASKVTNKKVKLDYEDGVMVYEVDFKADGYEYECEVNATTGEIVKYEKEVDDDGQKGKQNNAGNGSTSTQNNGGTKSDNTGNDKSDTATNQNDNTGNKKDNTSTQTGNTSAVIGEDKAKEIALSHAGLSASQISRYSIELDVENGTKVYEIEFKAGGYEYEYDINAATGSVVKYDRELDDHH